jgi:ubiquitin-activating enzyme E1
VEEIKKMIDLKKSADFNKCVELARLHFENLFNHTIQNLLSIFPPDAKDKDGQPFWSGPKRAPTPIAFDPTDPLHVQFVTSCANLIAYNLGILQNRDTAYIANNALNVNVPTFVPKKIKVDLPGEENKNQQPEEVAPEDE